MAREIELKFAGTVAALEKLKRSHWLKQQTKGRARTASLHSVYFDTADCDLAASGLSLRIRKDGKRHTQTIKSMNGKTAPRWDRAETEASVADLTPDPGVVQQKKLREALSGWESDGLDPIFVTQIKRTAIPLTPKKGVTIEAAFDFGNIQALGKREGVSQPLAELELELKKGEPAALFEMARSLVRAAPLRFAIETKSDRGYALSKGDGDAPVRARALRLDPDMRSSDAFALILCEGLRQIIANEAAILRARDVEGIHQMRVAMRRLRSAISAFGKAYDHGEMARLKTELKWLGAILGAARDWDIFQERILHPVAKVFSKDSSLFALNAAARAARRESWDAVLAALESERYRLLMVDIAAAASAHSWVLAEQSGQAQTDAKLSSYDRPVARTARKCLNKRLASVEALGAQIDELSVEERHELRLRLKRLRYAADFLQSCFPAKSARRYLRVVQNLQDVFGELNDVAVAECLIAHLEKRGEEGGGDAHDAQADRALGRAGGMVLGWHMSLSVKLWSRAKKRWRRLADAKAFWR
jgi:inorganic triphosphatase YgiF